MLTATRNSTSKLTVRQEVKKLFDIFYSANDIVFNSERHVYTVNGELFTGITTIEGVRQKDFLAPWAVKEAYKFLQKNWDISKKYNDDEKEALLMAAKGAWTNKSNRAKDSGTTAHEWVSDYILGKVPDRPEDKEANLAIDAFLKWEEIRKPVWVCSEKILVSLKHKVAGTLDSLAILDGKLTLVDFKTSGTVSESWIIQLFGYEILLEEMGIFVEDRIILRLPKDGKDAEVHEIIKGKEQFFKETFLHCRELHRFNVFVKNNLKKDYNVVLKGVQ